MDDQALTKLLLANSPKDVWLVGVPVHRLSALLTDATAATEKPEIHEIDNLLAAAPANASQDNDRTNRVMCLHLPSEHDELDLLVGQACRLSPQLVIAENAVPDAEANHNDEFFFAYGFRRLGAEMAAQGGVCWYAYSLSDYKQAPDWLNARFWAHPERFDLLE